MRTFVFALLMVAAVAMSAAETRDSQAVMAEIRLKQITKNLTLTEDQQKKVKALYAIEAKELGAVNADEKLDIVQKLDRKKAIVKATQDKIRPMLTEEQRKKWDDVIAKSSRNKNAGAAAPASPSAPAAP